LDDHGHVPVSDAQLAPAAMALRFDDVSKDVISDFAALQETDKWQYSDSHRTEVIFLESFSHKHSIPDL
jgi:hypothetical protein